jgi:hypothetical protein
VLICRLLNSTVPTRHTTNLSPTKSSVSKFGPCLLMKKVSGDHLSCVLLVPSNRSRTLIPHQNLLCSSSARLLRHSCLLYSIQRQNVSTKQPSSLSFCSFFYTHRISFKRLIVDVFVLCLCLFTVLWNAVFHELQRRSVDSAALEAHHSPTANLESTHSLHIKSLSPVTHGFSKESHPEGCSSSAPVFHKKPIKDISP